VSSFHHRRWRDVVAPIVDVASKRGQEPTRPDQTTDLLVLFSKCTSDDAPEPVIVFRFHLSSLPCYAAILRLSSGIRNRHAVDEIADCITAPLQLLPPPPGVPDAPDASDASDDTATPSHDWFTHLHLSLI
ncbi:hypothetical protein PENTCL1PPCAC_28866, partial [Pristionchus entomophagus]